MILLELTEKEAEIVKESLKLKIENISLDDDAGYTERTRLTNLCSSVSDKIHFASQPKEDFLITSKDLFLIVSYAKQKYLNLPADLYISNKRTEESDFKHIALANALIMWLNGNGLMKRLVGFDYTDQSTQYEGLED